MPWFAISLLACGLVTWVLFRLWDRQVRREAEQTERLVLAAEAAVRQRADEIALSERRYRALAEASSVASWRADAQGKIIALEGWSRISGQPDAVVLGGTNGWLQGLHPEDRAAAAAAWTRSVETGSILETEFRVWPPGATDWHWCRSRGVPILGAPDADNPQGRIAEWIGVVEDIDARRRAEAQRLLLVQEVNHRAKNLLAVVQTVVRMSGFEDRQVAAKVLARIRALARAHELLAEREWREADLRVVAGLEVAAYHDDNPEPAIALCGPPVPLSAIAVQPISMVLHELTTNAARHGALATGGRVAIEWDIDDDHLRLLWSEVSGGPVTPPARHSFGTRVIDATVKDQLGGSIQRHWSPTGLVCDIRLPLARVQGTPPASRTSLPPLRVVSG